MRLGLSASGHHQKSKVVKIDMILDWNNSKVGNVKLLVFFPGLSNGMFVHKNISVLTHFTFDLFREVLACLVL